MSLNTSDATSRAPGTFLGYEKATRAAPPSDLVHVGPGKPLGELLRRYWHPVVQSSELPDGHPLRVRVLDEDLVLFRDHGGNLGLLHLHCPHRQTSLEFGRVSERGLRCCYHGWLFDVDGTVLEAPPEPENDRIKKTVRQGAYPVREYKGLIFAYMGPPTEMPDFPLFDTFEQEGHEMVPYSYDYPCHWLQTAENVIDPFHTVFLHTRISGSQFSESFGEMPLVEWRPMPSGAGIYLVNVRRVKEHLWIRTQESFRPNFSQTGDIWQEANEQQVFCRVGLSKWIVPIDDTNCRVIGWRYFAQTLDRKGRGDRGRVGRNAIDFIGQLDDRSYEEKQIEPGDFEAIVSQGGRTGVAEHGRDHLASTDVGVAMVRKYLREAVATVSEGRPLSRPVKASNGLFSSYTQDTVIRWPEKEGDAEKAERRRGARLVADIIVAPDDLPLEERREEIRRRINATLGTEL